MAEGNRPPPILLNAIVAKEVIQDVRSGNISIISCFRTITPGRYPHFHGSLLVFCQFTSGHGRMGITARLVDDNDSCIDERTTIEDFEDPRAVQDSVFDFQGVLFPQPGEYRVQILAGTMLLGERRIVCTEPMDPSEYEERIRPI